MSQEMKKISTSISDTPVVPSNPQINPVPAVVLSLSCNLCTACLAIMGYMDSQNSIQAANSLLEEDISKAERDLTTDFNKRENARFASGKAGEKEKEELKTKYVPNKENGWEETEKFFEDMGGGGAGGAPHSGNISDNTPKGHYVKGHEFDKHASNIEYQLQHFHGSSKQEKELTARYNEQTNKEQAEVKTMDGNNTVMSNMISQVAQGLQGLMATFGAINAQEGNMARLATAV